MQMPLYMAVLWLWEKFFGSAEYALRALNIPFFVGAIGVAVFGLRTTAPTTRTWLILFSCTSPMIWAYLDEARPYILQLFAAMLAAVPLVEMAASRTKPGGLSLAAFSAGIVLLCASSLVGVLFAFFFGLAYLILWLDAEPVPSLLKRRDFWFSILLCAPLLTVLALYYLWTLRVGAKASGVGTTNFLTLGFCLYEFLGFAGAGPSRAALRENPFEAIKAHWPALVLYAAVVGAFAATGFMALRKEGFSWRRRQGLLCACLLLAAASVLAVGFFGAFRVIGRHLMPLLPFFLFLEAVLAAALWRSAAAWKRAVPLTMLLVSLSSALAIRFSNTHAKDDYRSAAAATIRLLKPGEMAWWAADPASAKYYGLDIIPFSDMIEKHGSQSAVAQAIPLMNATADQLAAIPRPQLVVLSKPDIYDARNTLSSWLKEHGYACIRTFPAFELYSR